MSGSDRQGRGAAAMRIVTKLLLVLAATGLAALLFVALGVAAILMPASR